LETSSAQDRDVRRRATGEGLIFLDSGATGGGGDDDDDYDEL